MNKYTLFIIVMLDSICAFAQIESSTSRFEEIAVDSLKNRILPLLPTHHIPGHFQTLQPDFSTSNLKFPVLSIPLYKDLALHLGALYPNQATLFNWSDGGMIVNGLSTSYPGLMKIDSGSLGVYQKIGNLSYYVGGIANKYGYFKGVYTQYGINGCISYQFTSDLSLTAFGTYYFGRPPVMHNGLPLPPSMIGYYGVSRFGGYFDYRISERFGVKIGGQVVQRFGLNSYEFEPIATPYINAGSEKRKFKIELPVGQILYNALTK